jgi:predicted naringenin-chalcone synthase
MTARVIGIGTAVPESSIDQEAAADFAVRRMIAPTTRDVRRLREVYRRSGVARRGSVLLGAGADEPVSGEAAGFTSLRPDRPHSGPTTAERMHLYSRHAPRLAIDAARRSLDAARIAPAEITHLVTVSCTGFASPGVEFALIDGLGLPRGVRRASLGFMGCHGAINGLQVARSIVWGEPRAVVLVTCVELCTLHFQYSAVTDRMVSNALFADGASAVVVASRDAGGPVIADTASAVFVDTAEHMTWTIGDHGFEMSLSPHVPRAIATALRPWIDEWLASHALSVEGVNAWAVHAGGPRIISMVAERLCLREDRLSHSRGVLRDHGNMSSATVLFALQRLLESRIATPLVALAFGPGLAAEAALFM